MSLHIYDGHQFCSWADNISPFRIHPITEIKHNLSEYGICFIIQQTDSFFEELEFVCQNTEFNVKKDFQKLYIYYGQTLYTTHKQTEFRNALEIIRHNITKRLLPHKIMLYTPAPLQ